VMKSRPKIGLKEFARRRKELAAMMDDNGIAILPGASLVSRNSDVDYSFRQDSDFHYLTGFDEQDAVFVLIPGREHGEAILFCRERDPEQEQWHGKITGPKRAMQLYGMDDAFPISDIDDILPGLIEGKPRLYYAMGHRQDFDTRVISWVNSIASSQHKGTKPPGEFVQLEHLVHELRLFKSKQEIEVMKYAAKITADAHKRIMKEVEPGLFEYELEAELNHTFLRGGARSAAYPSIFGSGNNANILHYIENGDVMKSGELVLVDAGAEYESYAADVTRTFPIGGKFSEAQKEIYNIVLAAQEAAIDMVKPGNHWNQPHEAVVRVISQGLLDLKLLDGPLETILKKETYKKFYMHRTGHWLGLDVHDVGEYRIGEEWRVFEPGMVTTIEPGIYISQDLFEVPARYRGIGVRIEDDVLVTKSGNELLTAGIPKTTSDIEALMASKA
jgi:Xaa-Pro aminopeptidase